MNLNIFGRNKNMARPKTKTYEQEIRELEEKYGKIPVKTEKPVESPINKPEPPVKPTIDEIKEEQTVEDAQMDSFISYYKAKYGKVQFPADIGLQNQLLFAIWTELVEIKTGNEEAREVIMKEKAK